MYYYIAENLKILIIENFKEDCLMRNNLFFIYYGGGVQKLWCTKQ